MIVSRRLKLLAATALTGAFIASAAWAADPTYQFDIGAQSLSDALKEFSQASAQQIIFADDVVRGRRAPAVRGAYTSAEALDILLAGTNLVVQRSRTNTIMIKPREERRSDVRASGSTAQIMPDAGRAQTAQADTANDVSSSPRIEEVIVTARKRSESLQDVPLSISVVSAEDIARRGLVGAGDYLRGLPGVNQTDSSVGPSIVIRGLETTTALQGFGSGNTVATYFGESSTTNSGGVIGGAGIDIKVVDVARVEVLKGPQGTAFGSSSLGGVVRIIPQKPQLDSFSGQLRVGASLTEGTGGDNNSFEAVANLPLSDQFALRAVGYRFRDSGYYRNTAASDAELQASATRFGALAFANNRQQVGETTVTGGRLSGLFQPTDAFSMTLSYVRQSTVADGWEGSNRTGYNQAILQVGPERFIPGHRAAGQDYDIELVNAVAEYDLGWGTLLATYSHLEGISSQAFPFSVRPPGVLQLPMFTASEGDHNENSGEVRLATTLDGPWNFVGGVYAEHLNDSWIQPLYWYGDVTTSTFPSRTQLVNVTNERGDLTQRAAFGEVTWAFLQGFELTGGVRAYEYERHVVNVAGGDVSGGTPATPITTDRTVDASGTNFRANLSYKPTDDTMVYAGWAQGFRLGKPQSGLGTGACDVNGDGVVDGSTITIASTRQIQSDSVDSYEAGAKVMLLDRRVQVTGSVFRAEWDNIPVQIQQRCGVTTLGYTANAGRARSDGVEVQISLQVTDNFRADVGASYTDAHLRDAVPAQGFLAGDRLPSPRGNANLGLEYTFLLGTYDAYVRADSTYVGRFYSTVGNRVARNAAGDYVKVDASLGVVVRDVAVDVFVRNLLDADNKTYVINNNTALRMRPRTVGVRLGYDF